MNAGSIILMVEGLFLVFFLIDLVIRLGNSDLWHPAKGGERPMDFAYLNAILKSTSFPPYDPWFAGGYINYYYYGYVIVGTPVKLLGIVPSIAYNFILPTLFACVGMAAFSVGWNLLAGAREPKAENHQELDPSGEPLQAPSEKPRFALFDSRFIGGISAASAMILLGNLGVVRMVYQGFQQIAAPGGLTDKGNIFQHIFWAIEGFFMTLIGRLHLPYGPGDWYWNPSRALPGSSGSPITEFPLFTFIYSDLHAHMIALMITVLAIAWALSVLMAKARWKNRLDLAAGLFLGAPGHRSDQADQYLGFLHLSDPGCGRAGLCRLALRGCFPLAGGSTGDGEAPGPGCRRRGDSGGGLASVLPALYALVLARCGLYQGLSLDGRKI